MPKSARVTKIDGIIRRQKVPMKLRIGSRKSGKSAIAMSNAELFAVLESPDKRKWHSKARAVLTKRLPAHVVAA